MKKRSLKIFELFLLFSMVSRNMLAQQGVTGVRQQIDGELNSWGICGG